MEIASFALMSALGVLAGGLTTVAGLGGGVLLILALSLASSPAEALATTSPALLVGNLHRLVAGRREVDREVARPLALGALPGSALGGLLAVAVPTVVLEALLLATTGFALARVFGHLHFRPGARSLAPAGFGIGAATATTGGGALLLAPLLLATGLTGSRYVATAAGVAVAIHVGRLIGYGAGGLVTREALAGAAVLAAAIVVGNALGQRLRARIDGRTGTRLELAVLLVCVALALAGLV
jgi:uncharacterized membrane protein YfcA